MREARNKIAEIKKDRGYGKIPNAKSQMHGNQIAAKKSKTFCWDCGQTGHWSGDAGCPSPGQGLYKPKAAAKKPAKQVRVTETLNTEHLIEDQMPATSSPDQHEVMVTQHLLRPSSLQEALDKEHGKRWHWTNSWLALLTARATERAVATFGFRNIYPLCPRHLRQFAIWFERSQKRRFFVLEMEEFRPASLGTDFLWWLELIWF